MRSVVLTRPVALGSPKFQMYSTIGFLPPKPLDDPRDASASKITLSPTSGLVGETVNAAVTPPTTVTVCEVVAEIPEICQRSAWDACSRRFGRERYRFKLTGRRWRKRERGERRCPLTDGNIPNCRCRRSGQIRHGQLDRVSLRRRELTGNDSA